VVPRHCLMSLYVLLLCQHRATLHHPFHFANRHVYILEAAWLNGKMERPNRERYSLLTWTGLLMEGLKAKLTRQPETFLALSKRRSNLVLLLHNLPQAYSLRGPRHFVRYAARSPMDCHTASVPETHYHIHWLNGKVDWERHDTRAEAEQSAARLSRPGEQYAIEQFDKTCVHCRTTARRADLRF